MSLIPPESLSFPDDFSRSISRARVLHERQRYARKTAPRSPNEKRSALKPQPAPKPQPVPMPSAKVEVAQPPKVEKPAAEPNGDTGRVTKQSAPARAPIARKPLFGQMSNREVAIKAHAQPARGKTPAPVRLPKTPRANSIVDLVPKPESEVVPAPAPLANVAEPAPERPNEPEHVVPAPPTHRRRRRKLQRFLKMEIPALIILLAAAGAGVTHQFRDPVAVMALNIITIASAFVSAIVPIVLFAKPPTLPPNQR